MTIEEKLRLLAACLRELQGGEWSAREVIDFARAADEALPKSGLKFRNATAYNALYNFDLPGRRAAGKRRKTAPRGAFPPLDTGPDEMLPGSNSGSNSGEKNHSPQGSPYPSPTPLSHTLPNPSLFTLTSFGMRAENGDASSHEDSKKTNNGKAKRASKPVDLSWIEPLQDAAKSLAARALQDLAKDERIVVGRFFALRFSNCTREAIKNKTMGLKIASGLASLGSNSLYGDMTVREFIRYCEEVHRNLDGKPWHDPWLIKSVVEFER